MIKINYLDIYKGSKNTGDWFIQESFKNEFENDFELVELGAAHLDATEKALSHKGPLILVSSNVLPIYSAKEQKVPWKTKNYTGNNIIPISAGTNSSKKQIKYNLNVIYNFKILYPLFPIVLPAMYLFAPVIQFCHSLFLTKANSRRILKRTIDLNAPISVRTKSAYDLLVSIGAKNVFLTGCITTWGIKDVDKIQDTKKKNVIVSFTNEKFTLREKIICGLEKEYEKVIVWHQNKGTKIIQKYKKPENVIFDWEEMRKLVKTGDFDYIGSRLHAGIFTIKNGGRSFFIAVDHRVQNFSKLLGFKYLNESDWHKIFTIINEKWLDEWKGPDLTKINEFKESFKDYLTNHESK